MTTAISALLVLTTLAAEPQKPPRVAVPDVQSPKELQSLAGALGGVVANELQRLGTFQVTTTDQMRQMLSLERQAQLLGCPDDSCKNTAVSQFGFDYLVTGKLAKLDAGKGKSSLTFELAVLNVKTGKRESSDLIAAATESELMERLSPSVIKVVQPLLAGRQGSLVVVTSEAGATVKVDDTAVGTTPLQGRLSLAAGPHVLKVEKEGFVTWSKEIRVKPDELQEESPRLVPSPDFINAYKSKQQKLRIGAWAATGLAVAGVGAAVIFGARASALYGNDQTPGTFLYHRKFINEGIENDGTTDHRAKVNQLKSDIGLSQTLTIVSIGVAAGAAAGAAALWLIGDDPGKYDAYKTIDVKPTALITPQGGGIGLVGSF